MRVIHCISLVLLATAAEAKVVCKDIPNAAYVPSQEQGSVPADLNPPAIILPDAVGINVLQKTGDYGDGVLPGSEIAIGQAGIDLKTGAVQFNGQPVRKPEADLPQETVRCTNVP